MTYFVYKCYSRHMTSNGYVPLGKGITAARRHGGLSQTELAERLGGEWNQKRVSRVENDQEITLRELFEVVEALGASVLSETRERDIMHALLGSTEQFRETERLRSIAKTALDQVDQLRETLTQSVS